MQVVDGYGVASRYGFDDPSKWHTVPAVPLLDEHEMTGNDGKPVARVDKAVLEKIAENNNRRVRETGDPATLILGHTDDDPRAPEKPAKGFVVNYRVQPYKRDPRTGQVYYAIHGDFKVRHHNKHLLEEYPRRSVELWWQKKELDPIALLGGTSPERDLGVLIRNTRLNHVSLDSQPKDRATRDALAADADVVKFSTRGRWTIETYACPARVRYAKETAREKAKVEKTMHEFKEGTLHSGSKSGPQVTSRRQAIAIALRQAGVSRKKNARGMNMESCDYDDADMDTEDLGSHPDEDPAIAKIFQSKMFQQSLREAVMDAIESLSAPEEGAGEPGTEGPPPADDGMGPPPGEPGMEGPPGEGSPEDEERLRHEPPPVKFEDEPDARMSATGMPGPSSTSAPSFAGRGARTKPVASYSRNGHTMKTKEKTEKVPDPQIVRMQRTIDELQLKLARSEAREIVDALKAEGIIWGTTPEDAAAGEADDVELLARFSAEERVAHVNNVIRKRYQRKGPNPAQPANPGVARFARSDVRLGESVQDPEEFSPEDPQEASDFADLRAAGKDKAEIIKVLMRRRRERS